MLLVGEVAVLAKEIEAEPLEYVFYDVIFGVLCEGISQLANHLHSSGYRAVALAPGRLEVKYASDDEEDSTRPRTLNDGSGTSERTINAQKRNTLTGSLEFSEKMKLMSMLDQWEEPTYQDDQNVS